MTLPAEIMDELLTLVHAQFDATGTLLHLSCPSDRVLNATLPLIGGNHFPHSLDAIRAEMEAALELALPKWRRAAMQPTVTKPKPSPPRGVERFYAPPDDGGAATLEARVRTMPYEQLAELCRANGLSYPTEAPNRGVLVMRARNCIYNALKAGRTITGV